MLNIMEISGKIIKVLPLQSGVSSTGNAWQLQQYVLEDKAKYPHKICFEVFGEKRIKDNQCSIDDTVTAQVDIESREFNGKWFTSVRAWKVEVNEPSEESNDPAPTPEPEEVKFENADESSELQF